MLGQGHMRRFYLPIPTTTSTSTSTITYYIYATNLHHSTPYNKCNRTITFPMPFIEPPHHAAISVTSPCNWLSQIEYFIIIKSKSFAFHKGWKYSFEGMLFIPNGMFYSYRMVCYIRNEWYMPIHTYSYQMKTTWAEYWFIKLHTVPNRSGSFVFMFQTKRNRLRP